MLKLEQHGVARNVPFCLEHLERCMLTSASVKQSAE